MRVGYRLMPHTADVRFEAWAPDREACVSEAISALIETFLDVSVQPPAAAMSYEVTGKSDDELLVAALEEIIFQMDVSDRVPSTATVEVTPGGLRIDCETVDVHGAELTGAVPKAVSLHELEFGTAPDGVWRCRVTVDI